MALVSAAADKVDKKGSSYAMISVPMAKSNEDVDTSAPGDVDDALPVEGVDAGGSVSKQVGLSDM